MVEFLTTVRNATVLYSFTTGLPKHSFFPVVHDKIRKPLCDGRVGFVICTYLYVSCSKIFFVRSGINAIPPPLKKKLISLIPTKVNAYRQL